ncbi:MAG: hypothetical protein HYZ46_07925 [Nitrosomonadales bacterium]|nr:hypothetical protein [Nitrosomonadales bacterium]
MEKCLPVACIRITMSAQHYKEKDHGKRTAAQDQGSEETQEATATRGMTPWCRQYASLLQLQGAFLRISR